MGSELAIVDYGAGNLASVQNTMVNLGVQIKFVRTPEEILRASRLVVPGVGAAGAALSRIRERGLDEALTEAVRRRGRPFLGICLGMQLIADRLYEKGEHTGLGWIRGEVVALQDLGVKGTVPHMGWNEVELRPAAARFFDSLPERKRQYYFCHSYGLRAGVDGVVAAYTESGAPIVAAVLDETVFAVQFHPEKSQLAGEKLIAAFLEWNP